MKRNFIVLLVTASLIQLYKILKNSLRLKNYLSLYKTFQQLIAKTPKELSSTLTSLPKLDLLKGFIFSGSKLKSVMKKNISVAYSQIVLYKLMRFYTQYSPTEILRVQKPSYLLIKDREALVRLFQLKNTDIIPTKFVNYNHQNKFQALKNVLKIIINIASIFNKNDPLSDLTLSHQQVRQNFLPQGSQCVVLGEFAKESNGILSCYQPKIIASNKNYMDVLIQSKIYNIKAKSIILLVGLGICMGFLLKQLYQFIKKYKNKEINLLKKIKNIFIKNRICSNCKDKLSCIIFKNCEHMNLCNQCYQNGDKKCKECQKKVKDYFQVYAV